MTIPDSGSGRTRIIIGKHRTEPITGPKKLEGKSSSEGPHELKKLGGLNRSQLSIESPINSSDISKETKDELENFMEARVSKEEQGDEVSVDGENKKVKKESQIAPILKKFLKNAARVIIPIVCIVAAIAFTVTLPLNPVGAAVFIVLIAVCYMSFAASLFCAIAY